MIDCQLEAVGLAAPGLPGWAASQAVLGGAAVLTVDSAPTYTPRLLPPNERRRATTAIRQAFRAGEDALANQLALDLTKLATVFASSDGDMAVLHRICSVLTEPARQVSPTDFHNSVHNAASGYFSIAIRSMAPAIAVAAFDDSFAAGLLEAATLAVAESCTVLLVVSDVVAPPPLLAARRLTASASCALLLAPVRATTALARLRLAPTAEPVTSGAESRCATPSLEALRLGCPAMRALPLLERLVRHSSEPFVLALGADRALRVELAG
jgi:hypothetical protein